MNPLVTPAWLANRLGQPGTVIVDATLPPVGATPKLDTHARYLAQHIPGAVFFDIEALSDPETSLPHMLPSPEAFSGKMGALGITDSMTIVVYEQEGVFSAPRAWWMLRTFGVSEVFMLDGGLAGLVEAGLPVETGPVERERQSFHANLSAEAVRSFDEVQQLLREGGQIVDARSARRFTGEDPEPRAGISSGHMPGSTSLPFTELVEAGRLKSADQLRRLFTAKGIDIERPITTTCGSGVTAAVIALGLEISGAKDVSLYDGSWAEYAQHPQAVIEKGP